MNQENETQATEKWISERLLMLCKCLTKEQAQDCVQSLILNSSIRFYDKTTVSEIVELDTDNYLYLVQSGVAYTFIGDPDSNLLDIKNIWTKGDIIFDLFAFLHLSVPKETTRMIEAGRLVSISYETLNSLRNDQPDILSLLLHLQAEQKAKCKKYIALKDRTFLEKAEVFIGDHPTLSYRINKAIIARFLGMSRKWFGKALKMYQTSKDGNTTSNSRHQ